jgi:hypothetical protein
MQDNTITLSVDAANDDNASNEVYNRYEETANRTTYVGSGHALDAREQFQLYRTAPKRNGESRGNLRVTVKFTEDIEVSNASGTGDITLPLIGEVSFSVPLGTTAAQTQHLRQRIVSFLDLDAVSADLCDLGEI